MSNKILIQTLNIGIKSKINDMACFKLPKLSTVSVIFTKNKFPAAPVIIAKKNIKLKKPKYLLINSGNANACTGKQGIKNTIDYISIISNKINCKKEEVLPFSTGIIGKQLPMKSIKNKLNNKNFKFDSTWIAASKAIMTTDKFNKIIKRNINISNHKISIIAICKGARMIEPNMATMLAFINIDIKINKSNLDKLLKKCAAVSFNSISVDGDMSTNDSVAMIATGSNSNLDFNNNKNLYIKLESEVCKVCQDLAKMIVRDGEGATKVIEINVLEANNYLQAKKICYFIANSNLFKTAMYGSDPNWGRIIARLGSIHDIKFDPEKIILNINRIEVFSKGVESKKCNYAKLKKTMKNKEIMIDIILKKGKAKCSIITSDLSKKYVHVNSAYPT